MGLAWLSGRITRLAAMGWADETTSAGRGSGVVSTRRSHGLVRTT
jgi:hypothetical protein